ncbi:16099_t:CDS:2, partial [Racocetra fulgida]
YHPNIDDDGSICVNLLKTDVWKPATKISQVLKAIADLLENPNPDDALVASIAEVYNTNKQKFVKTAKDFVKKARLFLILARVKVSIVEELVYGSLSSRNIQNNGFK